jgi:hypothetical protein
MKKQMSSVASFFLRIGFVAFMFMGIVPAFAQEGIGEGSTPVSIRYIGKLNDQPVFQIEFDNQNEEYFNVSIRDEEGNILFSEKSKDKKFSRRFQLDKDVNNVKLTFSLRTDKQKQSQVFEVNSNYRVVEDVVVTKL